MAEARTLYDGYARDEGDDSRVASTVGFVRDGDALIVIDPGMVPDPAEILASLAAIGVRPDAVTDVVFSHHHPDHTLNAALFPSARFHDFWAIYRGDRWTDRAAEGYAVSPAVTLLETPGHTPQDITTLVDTDEGVVAFTHLWWMADGPAEDPYAPDPAVLHVQRARVLERAAVIVPGHGPRFTPGPGTPR
ncbi:MAG TPA: MBL fold metallo-hydrolase [Actinomycetota bacterium]|jgi:glyoxylase-like metal-dependent hydrolase (beta-lactamase superfamily II)